MGIGLKAVNLQMSTFKLKGNLSQRFFHYVKPVNELYDLSLHYISMAACLSRCQFKERLLQICSDWLIHSLGLHNVL